MTRRGYWEPILPKGQKAPPRNSRDPKNLEPKVLAIQISTFIRGLCKADGSEYEPGTITSVYCSIDRHLRKNDHPYSITKDDLFKTTKEVVEAKRRLVSPFLCSDRLSLEECRPPSKKFRKNNTVKVIRH